MNFRRTVLREVPKLNLLVRKRSLYLDANVGKQTFACRKVKEDPISFAVVASLGPRVSYYSTASKMNKDSEVTHDEKNSCFYIKLNDGGLQNNLII